MEVHQHRPAQLTRALLAALLLALVAGCVTTNTSPLASLQAMEESSLFYPGSTQLGEIALDEQTGLIEGPQAAQFGNQLGTNATPPEIEQFYETELEARGWIPAESLEAIGFGITGSTETDARAWEKGDAFFRLSFNRTDEMGGLQRSVTAEFLTIYEARLKGKRPVRSAEPSGTARAP